MKTIFFDSKEANNRRREEEFLALPPSKRVEVFIKMVDQMSQFPSKHQLANKGNFVIEKKKDGV